uniref:PSI domain-containing protein n=1 Tax=Parastrongyloides trichosuri TaxID=131310 RepID=A0A0N4ZY48_PARTI
MIRRKNFNSESLFLTLTLIFIIFQLTTSIPYIVYNDDNDQTNSNSVPIIGKSRIRRDVERGIDDNDNESGDFDQSSWNIPSDVEIQDDNGTDHLYYEMKVYSNNETIFKKYYIDVEELLKEPGTEGSIDHPQLVNSYRKAVGIHLNNTYRFYGHTLQQVTIATGGFCYVGDQVHSWLAATQYIAPLMANFGTENMDSSILYADDGKKLVVEWKNVYVKDHIEVGPFIFQMSLYANGDIVFVYDKIPLSPQNITEENHPRKIGISDAYTSEEPFGTILGSSRKTNSTKRVIYEYHKISVPLEQITNKTVVYITAKPNCIQIEDCGECYNSKLQHFDCSWCHDDKTNTGFCSDQNGLHRRRQDWIQNHCHEKKTDSVDYCKDLNHTKIVTTQAPKSKDDESTSKETTMEIDINKKKKEDKMINDNIDGTKGGRHVSYLLATFVLLVIFFACWVAYAYYNPSTPSGQFLIKYRFSQWRIPTSHVRYSASLHT